MIQIADTFDGFLENIRGFPVKGGPNVIFTLLLQDDGKRIIDVAFVADHIKQNTTFEGIISKVPVDWDYVFVFPMRSGNSQLPEQKQSEDLRHKMAAQLFDAQQNFSAIAVYNKNGKRVTKF